VDQRVRIPFQSSSPLLLPPVLFPNWDACRFGYSQTPISNTSIPGFPSTYSNATYGPKFQAILAQGVGHYIPVAEPQILSFFGIA
jgi:hypothetical protein